MVRVFPENQAVTDFFAWLTRYQLGRKRLLDTMLAATFHRAGVKRIITNNDRGYRVLGFRNREFPVVSAGSRC